MKQSAIIHERGDWWVLSDSEGVHHLYREEPVCSSRWGTYPDRARAIAECDQRAEHDQRLAPLSMAELRALCRKVRMWGYAEDPRDRLVNRLYLFRDAL